jgi:hypothetical protein
MSLSSSIRFTCASRPVEPKLRDYQLGLELSYQQEPENQRIKPSQLSAVDSRKVGGFWIERETQSFAEDTSKDGRGEDVFDHALTSSSLVSRRDSLNGARL